MPSAATGLERIRHDRASILRVAVEVFNQHGYDATSMGVLAENLGLTKSAIYHHVSGKEHLLELALDEALGGLEAILDDPRARTGSSGERLEFVLRSAVGVLTERLPFVTLLVRLRGNTDIERLAMERRRTFDRAVAALVDEARSEGSLRSDVDARTTTRLLFGMINSIVEWFRPGGAMTADSLADDVIKVAFYGVLNK
ncbi:TetR/AcrR family transcriptional regulator [Parafrigoribacterium mesophilum]|uniref:TetR/AcrR family transcriptional regulator n=1 Tax=Parafrigoribacterium mesophilum TaxID=433646 RepID=UPI0031FD2299